MPKSNHLTKDQEIELQGIMVTGFKEGATESAKLSAIDARNRLVLACHDLVYASAKKAWDMFRYSRGVVSTGNAAGIGERGYYSSDDISSIAMEHLIRYMRHFDPSRGRLTTYVTTVVWSSFRKHAYIGSRQRSRFRNATDLCGDDELKTDRAIVECDISEERDWISHHTKLVAPILPLLPEAWIVVMTDRANGVPTRETCVRLAISRSRVNQIHQEAIALIHKCIAIRQAGMPGVAEIVLRNLRGKVQSRKESELDLVAKPATDDASS